MKLIKYDACRLRLNKKPFSLDKTKSADGFSLIEAMIAMIVMTIAVMGVFSVFTYATIFNAGNSSRSQALSVAQKEAEVIRSAKFVPAITDPVLVGGNTYVKSNVVSEDGSKFQVKVSVDDDPFVPGLQVDGTKTLKEIIIEVTPLSTNRLWEKAVPATLVLRRVRGN